MPQMAQHTVQYMLRDHLHAQMAQHTVYMLRNRLHAQMAQHRVNMLLRDHLHVQMAQHSYSKHAKRSPPCPKWLNTQYSTCCERSPPCPNGSTHSTVHAKRSPLCPNGSTYCKHAKRSPPCRNGSTYSKQLNWPSEFIHQEEKAESSIMLQNCQKSINYCAILFHPSPLSPLKTCSLFTPVLSPYTYFIPSLFFFS